MGGLKREPMKIQTPKDRVPSPRPPKVMEGRKDLETEVFGKRQPIKNPKRFP